MGKKVVVLGVDGAPYTLIQRFIGDGVMPNLAEIVKKGTLAQMDSSLPEVSSVAWTTFATGANPAAHGIYGFMDLAQGTYKMYFPNSQNIKQDAVWEIIGKSGKRSVVVNVPQTYPAKAMNGVLVAGFVAIDLKKATYPESTYNYLNSIGYRIDIDSQKARGSQDYLVEDLNNTLEKRKEAVLHLFDHEEWDLFIAVITETDRLHHFMWDALDDAGHKYHSFFREYYKKIDEFIGIVYERTLKLNPESTFMVLSDHGFTKIEKEVYLNCWLKENGYLKTTKEPASSTEDIADGTRAFVLDPSRIYINMKGRFPKGDVNPGVEYDKLRAELSENLLKTGVIKSVFRKEDIYSGPFLDMAPDLVLLPEDGYDLKGSIGRSTFMEKGILQGMHTYHDAVFFIDKPLEREEKMNISDVAGLILEGLGC